MKHLMLTIAMVLAIALCGQAKSFDDSRLPQSAIKALENAIFLFDSGLYEAALQDYDKLSHDYPDNYIIQYERLTALYKLGRYDEVEKIAKKVMKFDNADAMIYHIYGNALDNQGKRKEAIKIYEQGIKRFPDAGMLYLEIGIINLHEQNYKDAFLQFQAGIDADPDFASNYYRAAQILFAANGDTGNRVWAMVYGETSVLLSPNRKERVSEMGEDIRKMWQENIQFTTDSVGTLKAKVSLVKERGITVDTKSDVAALALPGVFEGLATLTVDENLDMMNPFTGSLKQLIALRKGIVENYFKITDNLYGNSMYLFPYLKSLIDAGHWEAYNFYLFGAQFPEDMMAWMEANPGKIDEFADWFQKHPFSLGASHTVSDRQIGRDSRKLNLVEAMMISACLMSGEKPTPIPEPDSDE